MLLDLRVSARILTIRCVIVYTAHHGYCAHDSISNTTGHGRWSHLFSCALRGVLPLCAKPLAHLVGRCDKLSSGREVLGRGGLSE
eukprot:SAG11_NODE_6101_length_1388_cov_1.236618_3_plen_85_part_01